MKTSYIQKNNECNEKMCEMHYPKRCKACDMNNEGKFENCIYSHIKNKYKAPSVYCEPVKKKEVRRENVNTKNNKHKENYEQEFSESKTTQM